MKNSIVKICWGTIGYLIVTFPLAYTWHLILFKDQYDRLNYISRNEPIIAFGFSAILLQGVLLSIVYPCLRQGSSYVPATIKFLLVMGGYHWTTHVLAAAAKQDIAPLTTWFTIETGYLFLQFLLGGLWLGFVYRDSAPTGDLSKI